MKIVLRYNIVYIWQCKLEFTSDALFLVKDPHLSNEFELPGGDRSSVQWSLMGDLWSFPLGSVPTGGGWCRSLIGARPVVSPGPVGVGWLFGDCSLGCGGHVARCSSNSSCRSGSALG